MRSYVAELLLVAGLASARAQARPPDSAAVVLVLSDSTDTSLGGKIAVATRAALIRLRDPTLWVVPDPFLTLSAAGPPLALSLEDILELGNSWGATIIIEIIATPQQSGWVHLTASLVRRQSPPSLIATIDAENIAAAADPLAEHIASDSVLRQRAIDDARRAREGQVFFEFQVDRAARIVDPRQRPRYPDELRAQRLDGEVLAQFVVDSSGHVAPTTFKVLKSTAPAFARAVHAFVGETTFASAELRGRRVSQLVQMPFQFTP